MDRIAAVYLTASGQDLMVSVTPKRIKFSGRRETVIQLNRLSMRQLVERINESGVVSASIEPGCEKDPADWLSPCGPVTIPSGRQVYLTRQKPAGDAPETMVVIDPDEPPLIVQEPENDAARQQPEKPQPSGETRTDGKGTDSESEATSVGEHSDAPPAE